MVDRHGSITDDVIGEIGGYCPYLRFVAFFLTYWMPSSLALYIFLIFVQGICPVRPVTVSLMNLHNI